ncbi:MAG TPA: hypothetical protein EYP56_06370 [Planctomycetaceae bacterium]|nr:hypothetical protein [Planctomycetaceae bacterium]
MKCPRCWAPKAYARRVDGWKRLAMACLLLQPMRCHHCYHKFVVPWLVTLGQQLQPPRRHAETVGGPGRSCRRRQIAGQLGGTPRMKRRRAA